MVDVLRAFTTTAFAFHRGAREIILVATTDEAFALRDEDPDILLMGEVNGLAIDGFDLPNSPSAISGADLCDRKLVMRTTAGTQGVVLARHACHLFVGSLAVASATAHCIKALDPETVSFVETGVRARGGGEEDTACADYIGSLLQHPPLDIADIQHRVLHSRAAAKFQNQGSSDFPAADLELALQLDRFDFAMQVQNRNGLMVLRSLYPCRPVR